MMGGSGDAAVTFERKTRLMCFRLAYAGLSGGATAAHFHGPAAPDANGPVVVAVSVPTGAPQGAAEGQATLTDQQAADLLAGRWYVNIHTVANPGGEIRGQVLPQR
jgi:CHRD domain